jgi:membrane associated rhomboid family serine protease
VAWVAHVGGFAFGVLVALLVKAVGTSTPAPVDPWRDPRFGGRYY